MINMINMMSTVLAQLMENKWTMKLLDGACLLDFQLSAGVTGGEQEPAEAWAGGTQGGLISDTVSGGLNY